MPVSPEIFKQTCVLKFAPRQVAGPCDFDPQNLRTIMRLFQEGKVIEIPEIKSCSSVNASRSFKWAGTQPMPTLQALSYCHNAKRLGSVDLPLPTKSQFKLQTQNLDSALLCSPSFLTSYRCIFQTAALAELKLPPIPLWHNPPALLGTTQGVPR